MGEVSLNIRLVFLGGGSVGKTAIIKRFLFDTYPEKYRPTVEDLFHKEFNLGTMLLKVFFHFFLFETREKVRNSMVRFESR